MVNRWVIFAGRVWQSDWVTLWHSLLSPTFVLLYLMYFGIVVSLYLVISYF